MKKLAILSAVAVGLILGLGVACVQAATLEFDVPFAVRTIAALAEAHIAGLVESMETVAATDELRSGAWDEMSDLLAQFEQSVLTYDAWFLLPDGSYYKVDGGLQSANLSDRAYFPKVMAGEPTLGDLVTSRSTGRKSMVLTVPVVHDGTVIGALGVTLYLEEFSELLADSVRMPLGAGFYARGADGLIAVHSEGSEFLLEDASAAGIDMAAGGIQISSFLGWTFVVGTLTE